jgi:gamma-glutamyltranspeptidase/glutathione hydrolase
MRLDPALPYASQRQPLYARNVVATSQPLAAQAGVAMLARGGNAVDAAIATAIALTVVEPTGNGIGSDLFAIVWDGEELAGLNASGRSPAAFARERFAHVSQMPVYGWDAVTIPGAVSGWATLSQRYGALPFADLFEPAIRYAADGFALSPTVALLWQRAANVLPRDLGFAEHFLPHGRAPLAGERFSCPPMARTLEAIAQTHGNAFYRGELAEAMATHARAHGGVQTLADFAAHTVDWVEPLAQRYRDFTVHELPPNGQGLAALLALAILEHCDMRELPPDSVASQHLAIEAMKLAFADTYAHIADPASMRVDAVALLDPGYVAERTKRIDRNRAQVHDAGMPPTSGTVYLATGDAGGMMVSLIQSNYRGFGSGVVVPGTGISLQNRANGFSLVRGHPNEIGGSKRPFHTIIPGFVTHDGAPLAAFGVMGAPMQPQGHVQTLTRMIDHRMNAQAVLDAPRWRVNEGLSLELEGTAASDLRDGLAALGHEVVYPADRFSFGSGQFVVRIDDGYMAGSDPRRDGYPAGF